MSPPLPSQARCRQAVLRGLSICCALLLAWAAFVTSRPSKTAATLYQQQQEQERLKVPQQLPIVGPTTGPSAGMAKVCIMQSSNEEIGQNQLADSSMYGWSAYAEHHGYRYVRVTDPRGVDPEASAWAKTCQLRWRKVAALRHVLPRCELLLLVDLDTAVTDPSIPLTTMLRRWGFTEDHLIAQPLDAGYKEDYYPLPNGSTILAANTGTMFWRNSPRSLEILEQFWSVPFSNPPIPVLQGWPCDQGVWNKLVRPTLVPGELLLIPCDEANGYPGAAPYGMPANCSGRYIQHVWDSKALAQALNEQVVGNLTRQGLVNRLAAAGGLQRLGIA